MIHTVLCNQMSDRWPNGALTLQLHASELLEQLVLQMAAASAVSLLLAALGAWYLFEVRACGSSSRRFVCQVSLLVGNEASFLVWCASALAGGVIQGGNPLGAVGV